MRMGSGRSLKKFGDYAQSMRSWLTSNTTGFPTWALPCVCRGLVVLCKLPSVLIPGARIHLV